MFKVFLTYSYLNVISLSFPTSMWPEKGRGKVWLDTSVVTLTMIWHIITKPWYVVKNKLEKDVCNKWKRAWYPIMFSIKIMPKIWRYMHLWNGLVETYSWATSYKMSLCSPRNESAQPEHSHNQLKAFTYQIQQLWSLDFPYRLMRRMIYVTFRCTHYKTYANWSDLLSFMLKYPSPVI